MSGTRSPSKTAPAIDPGGSGHPRTNTSLWRLGILIWPFATGAVAINLFLLGLMWQVVGLPAITPVAALLWSLPLGIPATWASARWARSMIREAES